MHASCYQWVGEIVRQYGLAAGPTLEVGSLDVNGSIRDHFVGAYIGVDVVEGPGVDAVGDAEDLVDDTDNWPVVVSTETLEHVARPWVAIAELARVCRHGGHVIVTARGYDLRGCWDVHHAPDRWRFSEESMRILAEDAGLKVLELESDPEGPGWFLLAQKG